MLTLQIQQSLLRAVSMLSYRDCFYNYIMCTATVFGRFQSDIKKKKYNSGVFQQYLLIYCVEFWMCLSFSVFCYAFKECRVSREEGRREGHLQKHLIYFCCLNNSDESFSSMPVSLHVLWNESGWLSESRQITFKLEKAR